ncbi:MAG TPA: hypothetical protein VGL60_04590, partial [Acidimicrobiales bacterium]
MKSRRRGRATRWFAGAALLIGTVAGSTALASSQPAAAKSGNGSTLSVTSFTNHFSAMTKLKRLAASGKGKIAVILPDTVSSARYTEFDAPYLARAFKAAGLAPSQYSIQNAQGSDTTQLTDAQSAVPSGAHVLVVDPRATPTSWAWRPSTRTSPSATTSTSSRTCSSGTSCSASGCSTRIGWR